MYDVIIIGGGVNGVAVAREAALRGYKVCLCEQGDLAGATSSASSKIAHGGLRYLEQYDFAFVRKGLKEREVLLNIAPHLVTFIGFIIPYVWYLRPKWVLRLGLFLYDHLYHSALVRGSRRISLKNTPAGVPLKNKFKTGFLYHDGWMDDARIVISTAKGAAEHGAHIMPRTMCTAAHFAEGHWCVTIVGPRGTPQQLFAKTLVNATGPWAEQFLKQAGKSESGEVTPSATATPTLAETSKKLTLVKGSHIVVPRLFNHQNAYLLQAPDGRVVFTFPYEHYFTLIGTTDTPFEGNPKNVMIDAAEVDYLCDVVNTFFEKPITREDIVWHYSGVRPLIDDGGGNASKASRDYNLDVPTGLPVVNIWGGKFTSHRLLGEEVVDLLEGFLGVKAPSRTGVTPLPGGEMGAKGFAAFVKQFKASHPWLPTQMAERLAKSYGTRAPRVLASANSLEGLGQHFGADLYEAEVAYLVKEEWATTAEDVLWRRSKLGLHLSREEQKALADYLVTAPIQISKHNSENLNI